MYVENLYTTKGSGRGTVLIVILVVIFIVFVRRSGRKRSPSVDIDINVRPYDVEEEPIKQEGMLDDISAYGKKIKGNFPWAFDSGSGMENTIEEHLTSQSLLIPNRSDLGIQYFKDLPRDKTILGGGMIKGELRDAAVAVNNIASAGTGSTVPMGQDSRYVIWTEENVKTTM